MRPLRLVVNAVIVGIVIVVAVAHHGMNAAAWVLLGVALALIVLELALWRRVPRIRCPYCDERIRSSASVCRHCGRDLVFD